MGLRSKTVRAQPGSLGVSVDKSYLEVINAGKGGDMKRKESEDI